MFVTDTMPICCSNCQADIPASTYTEDFFAGSELECPSCGAPFRYAPTAEIMKRAEAPVLDATSALAMVGLAEKFCTLAVELVGLVRKVSLPPPHQNPEDCPHTVYCSVTGCKQCGSKALH